MFEREQTDRQFICDSLSSGVRDAKAILQSIEDNIPYQCGFHEQTPEWAAPWDYWALGYLPDPDDHLTDADVAEFLSVTKIAEQKFFEVQIEVDSRILSLVANSQWLTDTSTFAAVANDLPLLIRTQWPLLWKTIGELSIWLSEWKRSIDSDSDHLSPHGIVRRAWRAAQWVPREIYGTIDDTAARIEGWLSRVNKVPKEQTVVANESHKTAQSKKPTLEARDAWLNSEIEKGTTVPEILEKLGSKPKSWRTVKTESSVRMAVNRYRESHSLAKLPPRKGNGTSGKVGQK